MVKGERIYYEIQEAGRKRVEEISERILRDLYPTFGKINFPSNMSSINKIYALLENGYYPWMESVLNKYGYDYSAELQFLMMNISYGEMSGGYDRIRSFATKFPSVDGIHRGIFEYQLDTKLGTIMLAPLTRFSKDSKIKSFALSKQSYYACHIAAQEFIQANPNYTAVTSLIVNQFGEQHYHSYIETPEGYADFANNIHLSKSDFERVMRPQVLNIVTGNELEEQSRSLTTEDLPQTKALLLRLAVHNQIKKSLN